MSVDVFDGTGGGKTLVSNLDTRVSFTKGSDATMANLLMRLVRAGQIRLPGARDPDDGCAGVPARA